MMNTTDCRPWSPPSLCSLFGIDDAIIAGVIGAAGSLGGAALSSNSAGKAADATGAAAQQASQEQARQFNVGRQDQQPWLTTGSSALAKLAQLYGLDSFEPAAPGSPQAAAGAQDAQTQAVLASGGRQYSGQSGRGQTPLEDIRAAQAQGTPITDAQWAQAGLPPGGGAAASPGAGPTGPAGTFTPGTSQPGADPGADFYKSPDYAFRLSESLKAYDARQSASGLYDSGATRKGVIERAGNLASGEFTSYANRLAALAGVGQTTATNLAGQGQNYAAQVGQNAMIAGDNRASSYLAQGNTYANTIADLGNMGASYFQNRQANNQPQPYQPSNARPNDASLRSPYTNYGYA